MPRSGRGLLLLAAVHLAAGCAGSGGRSAPAAGSTPPARPEAAKAAAGSSSASVPVPDSGAATGSASAPASASPPPPPPASASVSVPPPAPAPAPAPESASGSAPAPAPSSPLSPPCERLRLEIEELEAGVPFFFSNLKRPVEEINADVLRGIELARRFLAECAGAPAPGIRAVLGRLLMARHARHEDDLLRAGQARLGQKPTREELQALRVEVSRQMSEYFAEVESLITVALEESPVPSRARETALKVSFDLDDRLERHEAVRATAARILAEYPGSTYASRVLVGIGDSYFKEGRYRESADHFRRLLVERAEDPEYIIYAEHLFEALTGEGDLEGMEDLAHALREETVRRAGSVAGETQKRKLEEWRYNASFWIGFSRMARGDDRGAEEAFREHIAEVNGLEARLAAEGKKLDNVLQIYRDFRSRDLLEFLEKYRGQVPDVDFDLGDYWASEARLGLQAARGKVVAIVFRMPRYRRASGFLQEVDGLVKEKGSQGLVGITLGYLTGVENPAEDAKLLASLREDLRELGVSLPAGMDPDRKEKKIFRALNGTVGTPSFVILNRRGELSWFLEDPRDLHRGILRQVVERHLAEKP